MYQNECSMHSNEIKGTGSIKAALLQTFTMLTFITRNVKMSDQNRVLCRVSGEEGKHI